MSSRFNQLNQLANFAGWFKGFARTHDLNSMKEFCEAHALMLNSPSEPKFMKTKDNVTLSIAENILKRNKFLHQQILGNYQADLQREEMSTIKVQICSLRKNQKIFRQYQEWKQGKKGRIIAIGGPAATTQSLISSFIPEIRENYDINFYCRNYQQSNAFHSGNHSHARHTASLNSVPILSGHHLLKVLFKRYLKGLSVQQVTAPDFTKVDVKFNKPSYYFDYIKNEFNGDLQNFKRRLGWKNEHYYNRIEGVVAQQINRVLQRQTNTSFSDFNGERGRQAPSLNMHFVLSDYIRGITNFQHSMYGHIDQLKVKQYTKEQILQSFPESQHVVTAFEQCDDFTYNMEIFDQERQLCEKMGATWKQGKTVSKIYVDQKPDTTPFACGVEFTDGEFVPANKIHLTLGYKVAYNFENSSRKPLLTNVFPATGLSTVYVFKLTPYFKKLIDERGRKIKVSLMNSHWTIIDYDDEYALVRATAGGNTGAEKYMPAYFLNLTANTRNIFGEAFVGVLTSYGCVRSINFKNTTQFADLAEGLVISYGKGGAGVTKRTTQAYKALKYLGFDKQLKHHFQDKGERFRINQKMDQISENNRNTGLYYNNRKGTSRALFN